MGGGAIPWPDVQWVLEFVLKQHRGMLTNRKPDDVSVALIAMKLVEHMQRSGYTVFLGPGAQPHGGNFKGHKGE